MRGKIIFITILIVIFIVVWQYLPALSIYDQSIIPGFQSSKHKKFEDAEPGQPPPGYDSDGDGLLDFEEDFNNNGIQDVNLGETDRFDPDSDDDGLLDGEEFNWWMQRYNDQKAINKIPDWLRKLHPNLNDEQLFELFKPTGDLDGDNRANILDFDSDNDGWSDGFEIQEMGTDPANPDTDDDGVPDSEDPHPFSNVDSDGDGIPDDWEIYHGLDPDDPSDADDDWDNDGFNNTQEYEQNTDPNHPEGVENTFDYDSVDLNQFYEEKFEHEYFRVSPIENPKYWRLSAFDKYDGSTWTRSDERLTKYNKTVPTEVSTFTSSKSRTYNIVFRGSGAGYMPTTLHTTNMFNLKIDSISQPYFTPDYKPDVYYDSELGYKIDEKMFGYSFAMIDYRYSSSLIQNASGASGSEVDKYLNVHFNFQHEKEEIEQLASSITDNVTNDFDKVLKIINYLKENYHYSINYNITSASSQDPVYWFLFGNKNKDGICIHFTSAFVILSRLNGIPARFVTGFALGEVVQVAESDNSSSAENNDNSEPKFIRVIREGHRHSWAEVWFAGLGWLPFEVTGSPVSSEDTLGLDTNGLDENVYTWTGEPGGMGGGGFEDVIGPGVVLPCGEDYDNDGLDNCDEDKNQNGRVDAGETDPTNPDSDGDGLLDGPEINIHHTDPLNPDTDRDFLNDGIEVNLEYPYSTIDWNDDGVIDHRTDPNNRDTDGGGTWDGLENESGTNPLDPLDDTLLDSDGDELFDIEEEMYGTDKFDPDSDNDTIEDGPEVKKYNTNPLLNDSDLDGILDWEELNETGGKDGYVTDPNDPDTDGDGLWDIFEIENTEYFLDPTDPDVDNDELPDGIELDDSDGNITNPNDPDTDKDGLLDGKEDKNKNGAVDSIKPEDWNNGSGPGETDPNNRDTDGGGLTDFTEVLARLNPLDPTDDNATDDIDGDGLTDTQEANLGTNITNWDTDGDKLSDGLEVNIYHTDPLKEDTDDDNITDGEEVIIGSDPTKKDTDGDLLNDWDEVFKYLTDPTKRDTDSDQLGDYYEVTIKYPNSTVDWTGDGKNDYYTNPNNADTDGGGAKDGFEANNGFDPLNKNDDYYLKDNDDDGLINIKEDINSNGIVDPGETDPNDPDSDDDGLVDGEEVFLGEYGFITDPLDNDTDDDKIIDGEEVVEGNDGWTTNPTLWDTDNDTLSDWEEIYQYHTNPTLKDSDDDGLTDAIEFYDADGKTTDPNNWDSDTDGLADGWKDANKNGLKDLGEFEDKNLNGYVDSDKPEDWKNGTGLGETDPTNWDSDGGLAGDSMEIKRGFNPLDGSDDKPLWDTDKDRIPDVEEDVNDNGIVDANETDPNNPDTDNDGLEDGEEVYGDHGYFTDPTKQDTDNDNLSDYDEIKKHKTNPINNDTDGDTLSDYDEIFKYNTNPNNPDSDGDGLTDDKEVKKSRARNSSSLSRGNTNPNDWDSDGDGLPDGWIDGGGYNISAGFWGNWDIKNNATDLGVLVGDVILAEYEDENRNGVLDANETNNTNPDTDGGGAWDGNEVIVIPTRDPLNASDDFDIMDTDRDGLTDVWEKKSKQSVSKYQTRWDKSDTDGDGLWDGYNVDIDYDGKINYLGEMEQHNGFPPTFPNASDSDGDNLSDGDEVQQYKTNPMKDDTDNDGFSDWEELNYAEDGFKTNPKKPDSDGDGLWDGRNITFNGTFHLGEFDYSTNPNNADTDGDKLTDFEEIKFHHTSPIIEDTDGGSVPDGVEVLKRKTNPLDPTDDLIMDTDEDGLYNHDENRTLYSYSTVDWDGLIGIDYKTNYLDNDTDDDGLFDGEEVLFYKTNPLHNDTDNDTILDGEEIIPGMDGYITDPKSADTDNDGLSDILEISWYETDPTLNDSDGGGALDWDEIKNGTDPLNPLDDNMPKLPTKNTNIIVHTFPKNMTKGEFFTIKGRVTDEDENPLNDMSIKIYIASNSTNFTGKFESFVGSGESDSEGEFEISCIISGDKSAIMIGKNQLIGHISSKIESYVIFNESWSYNNTAQPDATILVFSPTKLSFIDPVYKINEKYFLTVQAKLTDISDIPLENQSVCLEFNTSTIWCDTTNETGIIIYQFMVNESIGVYELALNFSGSEFLYPARTNITLFVRSPDTKINMTVSCVNLTVENIIWVNGTLTGINDEPITSKINITFTQVGTNYNFILPSDAISGIFSEEIIIPPAEFPAGFYYVYIRFPGTETYSEHTSNFIQIFIKGKTDFQFGDIIVFRGSSEISVFCNLTDHQGNGLAGRYVFVEYQLPSHKYAANLVTGTGGTFSFPFWANMSDPLGPVKINLSYAGSKYYNGITLDKYILIKSQTRIIVDDFSLKMVRNQGYIITGFVRDDQDLSVPNEKINIYLGADENYWELLSVTTDNKGNFKLSLLIPTSFPLGIQPLEFNFGTSDKYESSTFSENIEVFSIPIIKLHCNSTIVKGQPFILSISLLEDNGKMPITKSIVVVYFDSVPQIQLITDDQGTASYEAIFPYDKDAIHVRATYNGSAYEYYTDASSELLLEPMEPAATEDYYSEMSLFGYILIIILIIIIIGAIYYWWYKHKAVEVSKMISDIMSRWEASDKSRKIIYEVYLKMLGILRKFNVIRSESETPREFADNVEKSLPQVNTKHLDSLTGLFEEARYSTHRLGKNKRSRAVRNLKVVRKSLEPKEA